MVKKKDKNPTLFVFDGGIKHYESGSMLELYSQLSTEEGELVTAETIKYKVFLDKLKTVACPILEEIWDEEDEWFRVQMEVAVSRIRNIDPLLAAKHNVKSIGEDYEKYMSTNAKEVLKYVEQVKEENKELLRTKYNIPGDDDITNISSL